MLEQLIIIHKIMFYNTMLSEDGNASKITQYQGQRFKVGHKRLALCKVFKI